MRQRSAWVAVAGLLALPLAVAGCGAGADHHGRPVRPASVSLSASGLSKTLHLGLVVSLQAAPGEGSEWTTAATGTQVAAYRYREGGHQVDLKVVDDHGTRDGAVAAVRTLVADGVAGIVVATDGRHLSGALGGAGQTPLLLPYAASRAGLPKDAFLTGPTAGQLGAAASQLMDARGWKRPVVVRGGTTTLPVADPDTVLTVRPGASTDRAVREVRIAARNGADVLVADLPAATAASLVVRLQSAKVDLPVILGRDGVSPAFGLALARGGGSLSGQLLTVGTGAGDTASLGAGAPARDSSAFFAAMRGAAASSMSGLFDQGSYSRFAGSSDTASHDAVVALVRAAEHARSTDAAKVLSSLRTLHLSGADGLAGPSLRFDRRSALADASVVPLGATDQDPGLRPAGAGAAQKLFWFAVPAAKAA